MNPAGLAKLVAGSIGIRIGAPAAVRLPDGCPVHLFACPVFLTPGCLPPPGPFEFRIGAGAALDRETARDLCLLEAIERFSLQHGDGDPDTMAAARLPGARDAVLAASLLRLGHPAQRTGGPVADSRGCSVGADLPDAALRGLLELIEHEALARWRSGEARYRRVDINELDRWLHPLRDWLDSARLRLRLIEHRHESGAWVYVAVCADASDLRPATGSAAGLEPGSAAVRACLEAVVAWLNIAEIERRGTAGTDLPDEARLDVAGFRGLEPLPSLPEEPATGLAAGVETTTDDPAAAFEGLVRRWRIDVAVFDLTRAETRLATARVVRLHGGS